LKKKLKLFRQLDQCTNAIMPKLKKNIPNKRKRKTLKDSLLCGRFPEHPPDTKA
jgi:hypothetical protein